MSLWNYFTRRNPLQDDSSFAEADDNITVSPRAAPTMAPTRKRKASEPASDFSAPVLHVTDRPALIELSEAQYNSIMRRRLFVQLNEPEHPSKFHKTPTSRRDSGHVFGTSSPPRPRANTESRSLTSRSAPSSARLPRRVASGRQSYMLELSSSEDELSAPTSRKSLSKRKHAPAKRKHDSDDDWDAPDDLEPSATEPEPDDELDASAEDEPTVSESDGPSVARTKSKTKVRAKIKAASSVKTAKIKGGHDRMKNLLSTAKDIDLSLAPRSAIDDIFLDMTKHAISLRLDQAVTAIGGRPIRVATMCSGTESPLLALEMIKDCLASISPHLKLEVDHLFSAEIVPFKQAYIERNFNPPVIFRDITELTSVVDNANPEATTAYGGKVAVPKDVDLVIAGTSCVDFSGLNSRQKSLEDGGESGDTWNAVLSYCRAFRPAVVLLENVFGAQWNKMLADYEALNYECAGAMVDTRSYYIPQVRRRGYMACFNKDAAGYTQGAAQRWVKLMSDFQRPASSAVSAFLRPNDQIVRQLVRNDEPTREVDWAQCALTQAEYRQDEGLGSARPVTHWSESGSMLPPEHSHQPWFHKQVERVLDTIDGAVLRKSRPPRPGTQDPPGMYDARFKARIFDLSQNIYREEDRRPFGVAGCITPSGMYFVTDLCRVLTSEEMLQLQGIPLSKISFTTETQAEVQDLAGNAMSTTVIGSSILASIISGYGALGHAQSTKKLNAEPTARRVITSETRRVANQIDADADAELDISELLQLAEASKRRCYCETDCGIAIKAIQQCNDCGHTTCTSCGGNPVHNYRQTTKLTRIPRATFEDYVRSAMPLRLKLSQLGFVPPTGNVRFDEAVKQALCQTFYFQRVRRTYCWTISYHSSVAVLELVVSEQAEWRMYANPDRQLPGNSQLRQLLHQPIAKGPVSHTIQPEAWSLRVPQEASIKVTITGSGKQIASWWSRNEMPDFVNHRVWEFITVHSKDANANDLAGKYQYLPRCGKACDSLYKRVGEGDEPIYLFLDPTQTGNPDKDCFVFSTNIALLEQDEVRPTLGRVSASWRPWPKAGNVPLKQNVDAELIFDEWWKPIKASLTAANNDFEMSKARDNGALAVSSQCSDLEVLLACTLPSHGFDFDIAESQVSFKSKDVTFFETYAWVFEAMRRHLMSAGDWTEIENSGLYHRCYACAPQRPELQWAWSDRGTDLKPYEDPQSAAMFERTIKARPEPLSVIVERTNRNSTVSFKLCVDVNTLAHRAGARLPANTSTSAAYSWRFITTGAETFKFKPFKISDTRGLAPFPGKLDMTVDLFPKQLMSLSWMRQQERGISFTIEETEEATIPALGWRAEARAEAKLLVRGGICADHPGFGKTITSLALIQAERLDYRPDDASAKIQASLEQDAQGLLPTSATLIICQASLVQQWIDEIHEKLPEYKGCTLAIKTAADLSKRPVQSFQKARIVVVSNSVFTNPSYINRLAAFGAVPAPFSLNSGRQLAHWLKFATDQIPEHLNIREKGLPSLRKHVETTYKTRIQDPKFDSFVPSKRLKGKAYLDGKATKHAAVAGKGAANSQIDTRSLGDPLFEMFYWNRIIVDEFHQNDPKIAAMINSLKADKRWGLSATPALGDFYELAQIGALLGVPLQIGSDSRGLMKKSSVNELRKHMTSFELFDTMRQIPTNSMHLRIHDMDQRFLDTFMRRNLMALDELPIQEHLVPVTLDLDHQALYAELSQHLNSLAMRIRKGKGASDREMRFRAAVSSSTSAEEALSKVAAFSDRSTTEGGLGLQSIVNDRTSKYKKILSTIPLAAAKAKGTEPANFKKWMDRLEDGALGDQELIGIIAPLAKREKEVKAKKNGAGTVDEDGNKVKAQGTRALTADLNSRCEQLLVEKRSTRYIANLLKVSQSAEPKSLCERHGCNNESAQIAVSALCGHMVCRDCYDDMKAHEIIKCPGNGCSAPMLDFHLLWPGQQRQHGSSVTKYGGKIEAALNVLQEVQDKDEQAVLFVQFPNQLDEIEVALEEADIPAVVVKYAANAGDQIKDFRESTKSKKTVIVLNASDETAAGINLQCANHVIFLSPLLRETQYGYDSTMAQAIGRVRRHGQKKKIHVYRIFAIHTVDVDILERSEKRFDALCEQGASIDPPNGEVRVNEHGEPKAERTQLIIEDGIFSLRPQSWLIAKGSAGEDVDKVKGKNRVLGWEDFSSLVKFSKTFTEDEED